MTLKNFFNPNLSTHINSSFLFTLKSHYHEKVFTLFCRGLGEEFFSVAGTTHSSALTGTSPNLGEEFFSVAGLTHSSALTGTSPNLGEELPGRVRHPAGTWRSTHRPMLRFLLSSSEMAGLAFLSWSIITRPMARVMRMSSWRPFMAAYCPRGVSS